MENHFDKPRIAQHCAPIPALGWGLKNIFGGTIVGDLVGNCGDERSDRDRSKTAYYDTLKAIENLKATIAAKENGENMQMVNAMEKNTEAYRRKVSALSNEVADLEAQRKVWEDNPEVAEGRYGLTAFNLDALDALSRPFGLGVNFTCNDYRNEALEWSEKTKSVAEERKALEVRIKQIEDRIAPDKVAVLSKDLAEQRQKYNSLQEQAIQLKKDINLMRQTRILVKASEAKAAADKAEQLKREEIQRTLQKEKEQKKNKNNTLLIGAGIAVVALFVLTSKN